MKVIHMISGGDVGGAKSHVLSLLSGLMKTETVRLVCFMDGQFAEDAKKLNIPTTIIRSKNIFADAKKLKNLIISENFDIVHCHGSRANMMASLIKKKISVPIISTVHSDYNLDYLGRPIGQLTYGNINKIALKYMDYYVSISDYIKRLLVSRGFDGNRIYPLYNGVDFSDTSSILNKSEFFEKYKLKYNENSVIYGICARISPVKDMQTLVKAFAIAQKECPDIRLAVAGDGEQAEQIKELAKTLLIDGSYVFTGWLTDTNSFYNALDVNMLTSITEAFPYSLPEGARMHCATIASKVGGVPDIIHHNENGLLFNAGDVETLAKYIIMYAKDESFRLEMQENLYDLAKKDFSLEATINKQKEIYNKILNK